MNKNSGITTVINPARNKPPRTPWLVLLFFLVLAGSAFGQASVSTDQSDYAPGSTATITGSGFAPGESVELQVLRTDVPDNTGPEHNPWQVTADAGGNFQTTWFVTLDEAGASLLLTATGLTSGSVAQVAFTDTAATTAATGGSAISADSTGGAYTTLTGPILVESDNTGLPNGSMILTAPSGFVFDTTANSVTVTVTGSGTLALINTSNTTTGQGTSKTVTPTSTNITIWVTTASPGSGNTERSTFTWSGIKVRPSSGNPLATGNIIYGGTSTGVPAGANLGTLTEVAGAFASYKISGTSPATAGASQNLTIQKSDQFGNSVNDSTTKTLTFSGLGSIGANNPTINGATTGFSSGVSVSFNASGVNTTTLALIAYKAETANLNVTDGTKSSTTVAGNELALTVNSAAANTLTMTQQPSATVTAGVALAQQPQVTVKDQYGNLVVNGTIVTATQTSGGNLNGTTTAQTATTTSGVATFSGLFVTNTTTVTLTFTANTHTVASGSIVVSPAAANTLTVTQQPSTNATAGTVFTQQPKVTVKDSFGNLVSDGTMVTATETSGGNLNATTTAPTANTTSGVATFSGLYVTNSGTVTLTFTANASTVASGNITVGAAAANDLAFAQQPSNATEGASITPAMTVRVQDQFGNLASSNAVVTLAIGSNPGSGTLSGSSTAIASAGVATFSGCSINNSGAGYTFTASATGLTGTTSISFDITGARFSVATGNWNSTVTWSRTAFGAAGAPVPSVNDAVTITNNVTVTADASCTSVTFTAGPIVNTALSLNSAITLSISGALTLPRPGTVTNTVAVGAGILNVGRMAFTAGGGAQRHQVTISTGTVNVTNDVTQASSTSSATITFTGAGLLRLGGAFLTAATGTLTTGTGTVEYNGAAQTVGNFIYNNLTLSGSGTKTTTSVTNNGTLSLQGTATVGNPITYGSSAILEYNGSAGQTVSANEFPTPMANAVVINNASGVTNAAIRTLNGDLTLTTGTFTLSSALTLGAGFAITRDTGTLSAAPTFGTSANVAYVGTTAVTTGNELPASSTVLSNLVVSKTGGVTLNTSPTVNGSVTIGSGAILDASASNFGLNLSGNWTNSGTFTPRAATVTINGTTPQTFASGTTFYNLTINSNATGTKDFGSNLVNVGGSFTNIGGTMSATKATFTFVNAAGFIAGSGSKTFSNLVINSGAAISYVAGSGTATLSGNFTNNGTFTQDAAVTTSFDNHTHSLAGSGATTLGTVAIQGSATVNAGSHNFSVAGNWSLTSGGVFSPGASTVTFSGTAAQFIGGSGSTTFSNLSIANTSAAVTNVTGFSASGTVTLSSASVLNLVAAATSTNLVIAGTTKAAGTWGTTASGANHVDNTHFQGTGKLTVTTGPASSTAITSSSNPSVFGQSGVTFTATVTGTGPTPTGTLQFKTNAVNFGGVVSLSAGTATSTALPTTLPTNNYAITAVYNGDDNFNASTSSTLTQTNNRASTTSAIVSSLNPALPGSNVTFTATLSAVAPGAGTASGTVTFKDGTTTLGTGTLTGSAIATFTTNNLSHGVHTISAQYVGDNNFFGSTNTLSQTNNTPPTASNAAFTRAPGQSYKVRISDLMTTNTADADGDTNKLLSFGSSSQGATITTNASYIFYLPSTGASSNNNDSFTFTGKDGFGGTATATISITVLSAVGTAQSLTVSGSSVTVHCAGIPGYPYLIQRSTNLVNWTTLISTNAPSAGLFDFTDTSPPPSSAYYRTAQP